MYFHIHCGSCALCASRADLLATIYSQALMPLYVLDTDICSYVIKNRPSAVRERMNAIPLESQAISVISYAELLYGVRRSSSPRVNRPIVVAFVSHLTVLAWEVEAAEHYADLRVHLEARGTPMGSMDLMIAAHARSVRAVLVTNNLRHFEKVPGLKVVNWL